MPEKPSYLDAILSTHFNECDIAAADSARLAEKRFAAEITTRRLLQPIDEFAVEGLVPFNVLSLRTAKVQDDLVAGNQVEMALASRTKGSNALVGCYF